MAKPFLFIEPILQIDMNDVKLHDGICHINLIHPNWSLGQDVCALACKYVSATSVCRWVYRLGALLGATTAVP